MKTMRSKFHLLGCTNLTHPTSNSPAFIPIRAKPHLQHPTYPSVILAKTAAGIVWFLMAMDDQKALALGPEGPLMEEFWENVRRYALYALTVSTGALYTIFEPIGELLKNPITAVLILLIFGGSFYVLSQVLSVMLGVSEFNYDYSY
ncbi:hypothetical protein D5086_011963 [Populus alba]|uniref:Uncharacterized protein n=1 Tax=Populus alba TaxID=43335 RepID=A0ACC4C1L3_POPAL